MKGYLSSLFALCLLCACSKEKISLDWVELNSQTSSDLSSIYFIDDQLGYAVGGDEWSKAVAAETRDGGKTWTSDSIGQKRIYGLQFSEEGQGYAVGNDGLMYFKADMESAWKVLRLARWDNHKSIAVYDGQGIIVSGAAYQNGVIQKVSENFITTVVDTFDNELSAVVFSDAETAHAVGYGIVLRSTDSGDTWTVSSVQGDFFRDVYFPTPRVGYIVGYSGSILKTEDAGETWEWQRKGDALLVKNKAFRAVHFADEQRGYIVGDQGLFWRTHDGGDSWAVDKNFPEVDFYDVFALSDGGCVVGANGRIFKFEHGE